MLNVRHLLCDSTQKEALYDAYDGKTVKWCKSADDTAYTAVGFNDDFFLFMAFSEALSQFYGFESGFRNWSNHRNSQGVTLLYNERLSNKMYTLPKHKL